MSQAIVQARREKISKLMAKSMVRPEDIARNLKIDVKTVYNDIKHFKKESEKWLRGYANNGYVYDTKQTIDALYDLELEMQEIRQKVKLSEKAKLMKDLHHMIITRWAVQGDGPTLMALMKNKKENDTD